MIEEIVKYIEGYDETVKEKFYEVYNVINKSVSGNLEEKLWAKLPSFYVGDRFVRIIPFKNHLNIEARCIVNYKELLNEYKLTPKGMLQIKVEQKVPVEILLKAFQDTFL